MFVNRKSELKLLNGLYASGRAELFVLYGRRRAGKTELLRQFCRDKPHIFFVATLGADGEQLAAFSRQLWEFTRGEAPEGFSFPSWEAAFSELAALPGRPVVVIDEFTYLISGNKAIPSILQKVWDERLKKSDLMLALCGSHVGMMEEETLSYKAPLYGRRTNSLLLTPMDLPSAAAFFPNYSAEQKIAAWAILGGMPYYLGVFDGKKSVEQNVREHILDSKSAELYDEPRLLLMEELREPRNYFSILRAIAQGNTRLNEIAQSSAVGGANIVSRYLDLLQQMRLVARRVPVGEFHPEKSRRGMYQIEDHFLRFWFRYVHPNQGALELGLADAILERRIKPNLDLFVSTAFEEAARDFIARQAQSHRLGFLPEQIGGWWEREAEIDVAAVSRAEKRALLGECKWSARPVGTNVLDELREKARRFRLIENFDVRYVLFSRSGFTPALKARAKAEGVWLVSAEEML